MFKAHDHIDFEKYIYSYTRLHIILIMVLCFEIKITSMGCDCIDLDKNTHY